MTDILLRAGIVQDTNDIENIQIFTDQSESMMAIEKLEKERELGTLMFTNPELTLSKTITKIDTDLDEGEVSVYIEDIYIYSF